MSAPKGLNALFLSLVLVLLAAAAAPAYELIAENEHLSLFLRRDTLAVRVQDRASGYLWSSVIEELVPGENNVSWSNFMSSGLAVEYFEAGRTRVRRTDLLSAAEVKVEVAAAELGFSARINFTELGISLELDVRLDGSQVVVSVPTDSIVEEEQSRLSAVYLYPFLGAVRQDLLPGYLFVPDGVGALIEFVHNENKFNSPYEERFFGQNEGLGSAGFSENVRPPYTMQMPVFGILHEHEKLGPHGVFAVVEEGRYNAKLVAYPNGVITQYNWITAKFMLREAYSQPTSRAMGGGIMVYENRANPENLQIRYFFSHGKKAGYVGMAQLYQDYLKKTGVLGSRPPKRRQIPLRLDLLGAEAENGLLRRNLIPMTSAVEARKILEELRELTGADLLAVYQGWNPGGRSGHSPYPVQFEKKLGGKTGFQALQAWAEQAQVQLHFYSDYTVGFRQAARFSLRRDAVRRINKTLLQKRTWKEVYPNYYYLMPRRAAELMEDDLIAYQEAEIHRLALDSTHILFSYAVGERAISRAESARLFSRGIEVLKNGLAGLAFYDPPVYLWEYAESYLDLPLYSSQYSFFGRTVPFLPLVLRGHLDYYAPYTNFFANQEEELLRLIEYGAYPSYYLTWQPAYKLKHTNSNEIFTSTYADWREVIVRQYSRVNAILAEVEGESMRDHTQLAPEVAAVEYTNGKVIVVNYSQQDYELDGRPVPGRSAVLLEVGEQ